MQKSKKILIVLAASVALVALLFLAFLGFVQVYSKRNVNFDADEALFATSTLGNTRLYATVDGECEVFAEISGGGARKLRYSLSEISPYLVNGFLAAEDREFYNHKGVNIRRSLGALVNHIFKFSSSFGASTVTQQVVKNISGDNEFTLSRKFSEMIRAAHIEKTHTKDEILETYLNLVPMSDNMAGVGIAAKTYFGKEPSEVTAAEAATIIGITNSPAKYSPYSHPEACREKRNKVLYAMRDFGVITDAEYAIAENEPLSVLPKSDIKSSADSWFTETVIEDLINDFQAEYGITRRAAEMLIYGGGLSIYTTVNPEIQKTLEEYFYDISNFPEETASGLKYSMVIADSKNGDLLALVGSSGKKTHDRVLNYATLSVTPGSTLKPLALYAPLLNEGKINWATVFDDVPVSFVGEDLKPYPLNSPNVYDGLTAVHTALQKSKNTVAVRMYEMLGADKIYHSLKNDFGFDSLVRKKTEGGRTITDLSPSPLALGQLSYGVSLRKLTEAYTVFPSYGELGNSRSYTRVIDSSGKILLENEKETKKIYEKEAAEIMNLLLSEVTDSGTARQITLKGIVDTAGKTGTSGNDKDKLFVGYTPYYTAGIWCGYGDGTSSVGTHSPSHLEVWDKVMLKIHEKLLDNEEKTEDFSRSELLYLPYCRDSGAIMSEKCYCDPRGDRVEYGYFTRANAPYGECQIHVLVPYDTLTDGVATNLCDGEYVKMVSLLNITDRKFPREVIITDAQYVWRDIGDTAPYASFDAAFFVTALPPGEYAGRSGDKKQFNSACYLHGE